jgi:hypothetical protein
MANVNITGIQIGDNTYYPRRVYEAGYATDTETGTRGFDISDCKPIDGLSIIIRFMTTSTHDGPYKYAGIKYVWTDLGCIPIKYMNINQPYLYFNEHDMAEFVFRGSGDSSVCELVSYPHNMIPITYSNLKTERDNGRLIPGMKYRITDYVTQCYYTATSSEHPFDIVVTAIDNHTLDENARAMLHDGDEYFANCDLSKWEIKYTLDADPNRFEWAKSGEYIEPPFWMRDNYSYTVLSGTQCRDETGKEFIVNRASSYTLAGGLYWSTSLPDIFVIAGQTSGDFNYVKEPSFDGGNISRYTYTSLFDGTVYNIIGERYPVVGEYFNSYRNGSVYESMFDMCSIDEIMDISWTDTSGHGPFEIYTYDENLFYGDTNEGTVNIGGFKYYKIWDESGDVWFIEEQATSDTVGYIYEYYEQLYPMYSGISTVNYQPITKGIIYHMKDEYGNECPYDFKNIKFKPKGYEEHTYNVYFHTFGNWLGQELTHQRGDIKNNVIKPYVSNGVQYLNNIVIAHTRGVQSTSSLIYDNFFDFGCHDMCFIDFDGPVTYSFYRNHFGKNCYNINQFVTNQSPVNFSSNNFGDNCRGFVSNGSFYKNNFGNNCSECYFGANTFSVCFGNGCSINNVGTDFTKNSFGDDCGNNRFGRNCTCLELGNRVKNCGIYKTPSKNNLSGLRNNCAGITFQSDVYGVCLYNTLPESIQTIRYVIHSDFTTNTYIPADFNNTDIIDVYYKEPRKLIYTS